MTRTLRYLFLLVFTGISTAVFAQSGAISGTVVDEHKEPMIGAVVQVALGGIAKGGGITDEDGNYLVKPLEPGRYDVTIKYSSYKTKLITGVIVSPDKTAKVNVAMELDTKQLNEVAVVAYKVPLIGEDERKVIQSEDIEKMATRNTNTIASTSAGVYQTKDGGALSLGGARSEGTLYIIDGVRVYGSQGINLAQNSIDQIEVIQSGLSAKYGDALGGVVNVTTKGVAKKVTGGFLLEKSVDGYGHNLVNFNLSGPLVKKKIDSVNKKPIIGFRLDGDFLYDKDNNPSYYGNYKLNDAKLQELEQHPLVAVPNQSGVPVFKYASEYVHTSDFEKVKARQNATTITGRLNAKLDYDVTENLSVTAGGNFTYINAPAYSRAWSLFSPNNEPIQTNYTGRGYLRISQRFPTKVAEGEKKPAISNAYYTVQADYQTTRIDTKNPNLSNNIFNYGYVGKFYTNYTQQYAPGLDDTSGRIGIKLIQDHIPDGVSFERSDMNPILANYTSQYFSLMGNAPQSISQIFAQNSLINGTLPNTTYGLFTNVGYPASYYGTSSTNQYAIDVNASFDLQTGKTRHAIEFGLYYQQQVFRGYNASAYGGNSSIWQYARQLTNKHITLDYSNPVFIVNGRKYTLADVKNGVISPSPNDTIYYNRIDSGSQSTFDRNLRNKLGVGATDYIDVDNYDPSTFSLNMFSADELLNNGNSFVSYYGYDYLGQKQKGQVNFNDFFTKKDANGNYTRDIGAYRPSYIAGYLLDRFQFKDINFNVGVRVDRFDANTKVLKDPYSLYEVLDASNVGTTLKDNRTVTNTLNNGVRPSNIKDSYVPYVNSNQSSAPNIIGYRDGDNWYDYSGKLIEDPSVLKNYSGGGDPQPLLAQPKQKISDPDFDPNSTFTDYKPQVNVMPRLSFSFPVTDQALFFAHYDVIVQRPSLIGISTPDQYYFFTSNTQNILYNPDLKPQKLFDYEVGFKQALTKQSAITITGFYKERKDMIQVRPYLFAWPSTYYTYGNRDFSTTKGLTLNYDLRRVGNLRMTVAYTLQFAEGTGSNATSTARSGLSGNGIVQQFVSAGLPNLRYSTVLDYDSRHNITATIDYRYEDNDGPVIGGKHILENAGVNFIARARSGEPYTKYAQPIPTGNIIEGGVNGARLPWHYGLDMKVDKNFKLGFLTRKPKAGESARAPKVLNAYVMIQNLLNIRDRLSVDGYTGRPDDDGYLRSPQGILNTQLQTNPTSYQDIYTLWLQNPDRINLPRRINLGIQLNF
ncbi:MAG: carboxypeptidase regulatory-like domain-containing protein [Bacteroidetes bacterium]|nr:carboxypeptidase regulatory-like domain-containing protein [Bacteroidota bacterium]